MRVNVTLTGTKHPRYEWVVRFTEKGIRKPRYFKKGEKAIAKAFADRKRIELENVGVTAEQIGTEDRLVVAEFQEQLAHHGVTLRQALDLAMEQLTRRGRSQTVQQVYKRVLNNLEADGLSDAHAVTLKSRCGRFCKQFGDRLITTITVEEINLWLRELKVAPTTVHSYRRYLSMLFNLAVEKQWCQTNPVRDRDAFKPLIQAAEVEVYTPEEMTAMIAAADSVVLPVIILGAFAGLRPGEIERLDWSDIDLPRKVIRVSPRKSGRNAQRRSPRNRYVEIRPNLYAFLAKLEHPINGAVYPFAKPGSSNIHYGRKLLRQMREKANVRQISDGLRHSYGTYLLALLDGDREKVADQMGNTRAVVDSNYRRPVLPEEAQAYWAIQPS
jgi:integrase